MGFSRPVDLWDSVGVRLQCKWDDDRGKYLVADLCMPSGTTWIIQKEIAQSFGMKGVLDVCLWFC